MELAIAYALYYPIGRPVGLPMLSLLETHSLTFEPITDIYRCYYLAREALQESNEAPIILNSANEIAVESFLSGSITFIDIADIVEHVMHTLPAPQECSSIEDILMLDERTRTYTEQYIKERYR